MFIVKHSVPSLDLSKMESLSREIFLSRGGDGWMMGNREGDLTTQQRSDSVQMFLFNRKAEFQLNCILENVGKIQKMVRDFSAGSFDTYIDEHQKWADDETPPFDPYRELEYRLATDGIEDLPEKLEIFTELIGFMNTIAIRKQAMSEAFQQFFGDKIQKHYQCEDSEGNLVMVPEKDIPEDVLAELRENSYVRDRLNTIEYEHTLDNYDAWLASIKQLVSDRRPFAEMLELFKDTRDENKEDIF